jgi:2,4-dienoyl-CoA reductase-like NADH-dependent reductase (Old Yellow Enzyme family)
VTGPATRGPALFRPLALRGVTLRNRIVVSPMCQYLAEEGRPGAWHMAHHARFALSGVGAAIMEATGVTRDGRITHGCTGLWDDSQIAPWAAICDLYRAQGVATGIQLNHAGAKAATARPWEGAGPLPETGAEAFWETVGPSDVAMRPGWRPPRPMASDEIAALPAAFAAAARRAVQAGFDMIELHGAHGYLLHEFLSPVTNRRDDAYGGDLARRMRLPLEVAEAVRAAIPPAMPLLWRASVLDNMDGGITLADSVALARALKARGVDLIDCSAGGINAAVSLSQQKLDHGHQVPLAEAIRREAEIPTMAVGLITDPAQAEAIVADGRADCVALARELIADPAWAYRAAIRLGVADPEALLPGPYAFYLRRRAQTQGR